jgi:hypothetical protein
VTQFQEGGNGKTRLGFVTELLTNDRIQHPAWDCYLHFVTERNDDLVARVPP